MQSGRSPLHEIMTAMASLHDAEYEYFWYILKVLDRFIKAGADVNIVDKVSYRQVPYYKS